MKKLLHLLSAVLISLSSMAFINFGTALAVVQNCNWTGAVNNNFNTAGNWSSCNSTVPQTGDNLIFDNTSLSNAATLNNDIVSLSVNNITFMGSGFFNFDLTGNAMTLTGTISASQAPSINNDLVISGNKSFSISGVLVLTGALSGSGLITLTGGGILELGGNNTAFSGGFSTSDSLIITDTTTALGSGPITLANTGFLQIDFDANTTYSNALTIGQTGSLNSPLYMNTIAYAGDDSVATWSGPITLTSDVAVGGFGNRTLKITGSLSGNFTMAPAEGDSNGIVLNNASTNTSKTPAGYVPISIATGDDQASTAFTADKHLTFIVDGTRGDGDILSGGALKGSGTVGNINVHTGGTLAPGHSPGCISTDNLILAGTYEAEIGGTTACTGYDQTKVTGTVNVTGATLTTSLYNSYTPKGGESYTIIDNDGVDAVTGNFNGLPEGSSFTLGGHVFKITYKGGTGNDVVLSVANVPAAPDTGFGFTGSHPGLTLTLTSLSAASIYAISRKYRKLSSSRR